MITSEMQKQRYIYYRCTKKRGKCSQPYLREDLLTQKINQAIESVAIGKELQDFLLAKITQEASSSNPPPTSALKHRIA
ncbi:MAG: hypothetical protein DRP74_09060, partial [Candidatus Omnitrophota bacterium]